MTGIQHLGGPEAHQTAQGRLHEAVPPHGGLAFGWHFIGIEGKPAILRHPYFEQHPYGPGCSETSLSITCVSFLHPPSHTQGKKWSTHPKGRSLPRRALAVCLIVRNGKAMAILCFPAKPEATVVGVMSQINKDVATSRINRNLLAPDLRCLYLQAKAEDPALLASQTSHANILLMKKALPYSCAREGKHRIKMMNTLCLPFGFAEPSKRRISLVRF